MTEPFQLFGALDATTESALRSSIERHGVLVPVFVDQHDRIIDGHHRSRIAKDLGVAFETITVEVRNAQHARELAKTLNADRRHLSIEQRREVVKDLREEGHSQRSTARALGVGLGTVQRDEDELTRAGQLNRPEQVTGSDGKTYPGTKPDPFAALVADYPEAKELPKRVRAEAVAGHQALANLPEPERPRRKENFTKWIRSKVEEGELTQDQIDRRDAMRRDRDRLHDLLRGWITLTGLWRLSWREELLESLTDADRVAVLEIEAIYRKGSS